MKDELLAGDRTPGLESLHHLRLTALLRDVVKRKGRMEASEVLRVNYKTLAAAIDSGKLTPRLCDALERLLLIRELAALEEVQRVGGEVAGPREGGGGDGSNSFRQGRGDGRSGAGPAYGGAGAGSGQRGAARHSGAARERRRGYDYFRWGPTTVAQLTASSAVQEYESLCGHNGASTR